mmetsp:Transcript_42157/g.64648  ORF Transcript_42157/g.64648 Transcript_42157/m.64648 type:complete len:114 (+) Transcript_42157:714-1055(+)|eukprot:CAMPEP_0170500820 /NCGR_PEP_ID=MMETSP0208-20121228/36233_1 /TAXON_ID=197538 /ORGANISM="Strombidium inclinatum, Strain S3" /LENGTH=113 /DNA_ID=CAMNT_0010779051 /DNA_START=711 /DNA_END=1052 /DNA_ORIENTATION=+
MSRLISLTIDLVQNFEEGKITWQTLAIVCSAMTKLGVQNEILFGSIRDLLIEENNRRMSETGDYKDAVFLKTLDCANFVYSFAKNKFVYNDLFYMLEYHFQRMLREAPEKVNS